MSVQSMVVACALSALVGGAVSGLIVTRLQHGDPAAQAESGSKKSAPKNQGETEPKSKASQQAQVLGERVDELESQLRALRKQQHKRAELTEYAKSLAQGETGEEDPKGQPPAGSVIDGEDPTFELAVRSVMDRVDWEKDQEQKAVRAERSGERARRQTDLLKERLGLTEPQTQAVAAALVKQMDRFRALRGRDGDNDAPRPATRTEWRERIASIRKETEQQLESVLSAEQLETYRTVAEEEGIGARGWGRGRGGEGSSERSGERPQRDNPQ